MAPLLQCLYLIALITFGNQCPTANCDFNVGLVNCWEFYLPDWYMDNCATHSWRGWGQTGTASIALPALFGGSLLQAPQHGQQLLAMWLFVARCSEGLWLGAEFSKNHLGEPDTAQKVRMGSYNSLVVNCLDQLVLRSVHAFYTCVQAWFCTDWN